MTAAAIFLELAFFSYTLEAGLYANIASQPSSFHYAPLPCGCDASWLQAIR